MNEKLSEVDISHSYDFIFLDWHVLNCEQNNILENPLEISLNDGTA